MRNGRHRQPHIRIRVLALMISALLVTGLAAPFVAAGEAQAAEAGADLEVRVGYFGDDKDYRTKAVLSRADLESMSEGPYEYSNVTRVGTVMGTVGRGPSILNILAAAGIDAGSVQTINLRTTDGTKVNNWFVSLNMDQWVNSTRYFYPELRANYERVENEDGTDNGKVLPLPGSLADPQTVPAILAIESYTTKNPDEVIDPSMMDESVSYRFCAGQTQMTEGELCGDVSSMNSAKWIFGIDVTLYGSAGDATDLELSLDKTDLIVGSKAQVKYQVYGVDLFGDKVNTKRKWTSSDPSVAKVDKNGLVTILKKGKVTITATTQNGISRSVTINATEKKKKEEQKKQEPAKKQEQKKQQEKKQENIIVYQPKPKEQEKSKTAEDDNKKETTSGLREILLEGDMYDREEMDPEATPLDAQKRSPIAGTVAMCGCGMCAAVGGIGRLIKYLKEVL